MARSRTRRPADKPRGARDRAPRAGSRPPAGGHAAAALAAAAAGLLLLFVLDRPLPWAGRPAAAPDSLAGLDPRAAIAAGVRLGGQGRDGASVPYFRRAVAGLPDSWQAHYDLSTALANAAVESRRHLGRFDPAMRSSAERIGSVLESERELAAALTLAPRPHDRALLLMARSQTYLTWGMPADALALLRAAQAIDPAWEQPGLTAKQIETGLVLGGLAQ